MPASPFLALFIFTTFVGIRLFRNKWRGPVKYFPGPPLGIFGSQSRALLAGVPWLTLTEWKNCYGNIIQLFFANKSVVVLNKADDAHTLLEKRGENYSDRPGVVLQAELTGTDRFLSMVRYGDDFRTLRRNTTQHFNSRNHVDMYPLLQEQVKILLKNLFITPEHFEAHLDRMSAATIVKATYGFDIKTNEDPFNQLAKEAFTALLSLGIPGLTPVDILPILRYVPSWFPYMAILRQAKTVRGLITRMVEEPYERVKLQRDLGLEGTSLVDSLLEEYEKLAIIDEKREYLIKTTAGMIYGAGVETSAVLLHTFFFEMIHHREVAKKAQAEIDNVLGVGQLPTIRDRQDLPYIDCILKEVLRINPPTPLGVAHASIHEDMYKGKVIPAGSIIVPNLWAMMHDEEYFPEPDIFNPDRFVSMMTTVNGGAHKLNSFRPDDPTSIAFGFGRRICPGRFIADASAWLVMANVLAAFDILLPLDPKTGEEVLPELSWTGQMTAKIEPFHARIVPRSSKFAKVMED